MRSRSVIAVLVTASLALSALPASAEDMEVASSVAKIFADRAEESFVAVVIDDSARQLYLAFYISAYLDLKELRAYRIPYASADRPTVDAALAAGDHAAAFTSLLSTMRITLGAQYVSDVGLDGINDEVVKLGEGTIHDGFHREIFADAATADRAYKEWLARALQLMTS